MIDSDDTILAAAVEAAAAGRQPRNLQAVDALIFYFFRWLTFSGPLFFYIIIVLRLFPMAIDLFVSLFPRYNNCMAREDEAHLIGTE